MAESPANASDMAGITASCGRKQSGTAASELGPTDVLSSPKIR